MKYLRRKISKLFYWFAAFEAVCGVVAIFFLQRLGIAQIGSIFLHAIAVDKWEIISEERAVWMVTVITRAMFHDTTSLIISLVFFPLVTGLSFWIGCRFSPSRAEKRHTRKFAKKRARLTIHSRKATV